MNKYFKTFAKYRFLLSNLIVKDIKVKYKRSVLGLAWTILNPLLMMIVITAVFSTLFRFNIENFPIYYLTGWVIFNFFSEATNGAMMSVLGAGALIKKVYIPKYIFPMEKILFAFVNMIFSLVAVAIMLLVLRVHITWTILLFPVPLIYTLIFSFGIGMGLSALTVFFRDIAHLYGIVLMLWTYLTPMFYPVEILPPQMMIVMKLNPMYHYINYFRNVIMYGVVPSPMSNIYCMTFALVALVLGVWVFKAKQDKFILYI